MDPVFVGVLGTLLIFVLLFLGMPIAFTCMLVGFSGICLLAHPGAALPLIARTVYEVCSDFNYTVIPLFIVMGSLAGVTGLTKELYGTFEKWLRRLPGGLGIATIAACAGFAAVSGSSVATAAAMSTVALPQMDRFNYAPKLAAGCVAAGGTLGFLIPPSLGFVVYGMLTEQSVGKLLIAGIVPGLCLAAAFGLTVYFMVKMNPGLAPMSPEPVSWGERFRALTGVWQALSLFLLVVGGIWVGLFTPTEAGAGWRMACCLPCTIFTSPGVFWALPLPVFFSSPFRRGVSAVPG